MPNVWLVLALSVGIGLVLGLIAEWPRRDVDGPNGDE